MTLYFQFHGGFGHKLQGLDEKLHDLDGELLGLDNKIRSSSE